MKTQQLVFHYLKRVRGWFFISIVLFALSFSSARLNAFFSAEIVGLIANQRPEDISWVKGGWLLFAFMLTTMIGSLFLFLSHISEIKFMPKFLGSIAKDMFVQIHKHSVRFFNEEKAGVILKKASGVIGGLEQMKELLAGFLRIMVLFVVSIVIIAFINVRLSLFFMFVSLFFAWWTFRSRQKMVADSKKAGDLEDEAGGVLFDCINNAVMVKSFDNMKYEQRYFFSRYKEYLQYSKITQMFRFWTTYKNNTIYDAMSMSFYLGTFYTWYADGLRVADIVFIISTISVLTGLTKEFSYLMTGIYRSWGRVKAGVEFLYRPHEVRDVPNAKQLKLKNTDIVFDKIVYGYEGKKLLFDKFNLKVTSGHKLGLVGRSGSGKSTLIKLLDRYYDLQKGKITIGGQNIAKVTQNSLRRHIAIIPQDPLLFNRTIMENIRYGNIKATDEDVISAAKQAYCHEFIMQLKNGYDSKVGEKGVMLSGGERQRIAIARAILTKAPILILDEATSALDSESEKYIQKSLKELMKNKTVIAIAHRLSTLKEMDEIVVMEKGKIAEQGKQSDLLALKGAFYNFYKMQSEGFLNFDDA